MKSSRIAAAAVMTLLLMCVFAHGQSPVNITCPTSVNIGVRNLPDGWSDSFFAAKNFPFTGSSADVTQRVLVCEYSGYMLSRPFPTGLTCRRLGKSRTFECKFVKPPPVKIPGKKNGY